MSAPGSVPQIYTPPPQPSGGETAGSALAQHARSTIEARSVIAHARPRDWDRVREVLLKDCTRPSFADGARYKKPIGKGVEGPSIRFVEAAIRAMGNIPVDTLTVYDDASRRIVRVTVGDLESNVSYSRDVTVEKTVERLRVQDGDQVLRTRTNSRGEPLYIVAADDDAILNKEMALISKAIRTLGLRLVPGDLVDECMTEVLRTMADRDAKDPDLAKRKIFDAFGAIGVTVADIKAWLGHDGSTLTPKELADLRALYASIQDGETTWRDVKGSMGTPPAGSEPQAPKSKPKGAAGLKQAIDPKPSPAGPTPVNVAPPPAPPAPAPPPPSKEEALREKLAEVKRRALSKIQEAPPAVDDVADRVVGTYATQPDGQAALPITRAAGDADEPSYETEG
jgi:hypothetical protein